MELLRKLGKWSYTSFLIIGVLNLSIKVLVRIWSMDIAVVLVTLLVCDKVKKENVYINAIDIFCILAFNKYFTGELIITN